jgi:hypothetical protein
MTRPPATCAACGQTFMAREPVAILGSRVYHKACRKMVERGAANPITESTPNEEHWRKQVIELEQKLHRMKAATDRGLVAVTAAENRIREIRAERQRWIENYGRLDVEYHRMLDTSTARLERIWLEARACQAVGRGVWALARLGAAPEVVDATAERYRLMELD